MLHWVEKRIISLIGPFPFSSKGVVFCGLNFFENDRECDFVGYGP